MNVTTRLDLTNIAQLCAEALQHRGIRADRSTFLVDPASFQSFNEPGPDGVYRDVVKHLQASITVVADFNGPAHVAPAESADAPDWTRAARQKFARLERLEDALSALRRHLEMADASAKEWLANHNDSTTHSLTSEFKDRVKGMLDIVDDAVQP